MSGFDEAEAHDTVAKANAERIVACVTAMDECGIEHPERLTELVEAVRALREEITVKNLVPSATVYDRIYEALAALKGKTP